MRIWIVMTGEALPTDGENVRLRRAALLARQCALRGHEVTWWTSTFDHQHKRQRTPTHQCVTTKDNVRIEMLHAPAYRKNISIGRLINHQVLGSVFARRIRTEAPPDLIFSTWPTIEFSTASVEYAIREGLPVIIDVRDLWPDIFAGAVPRTLRPAACVVLLPLIRRAEYVFRNCTGICAISPGYLNWALNYAGRPQRALDAVFPLGYDKPQPLQHEVARARSELLQAGIDHRKTICWFVGVFGATYDLGTVIRAAALLQQRGCDGMQFVLSGTGEREPEWKRHAGDLRNVVFTGWVDSARIACLGQLASIGLAAYSPSAPQGLPNKLFEYMAYGLPVVSSLPGEAEAFLRESRCGLTYKAGDAESLVDALLSLADTRQRREYGDNGRRRYETDYSTAMIYPSMVDYLEAVASPGVRQRAQAMSNL